jgi:hypothetical protein
VYPAAATGRDVLVVVGIGAAASALTAVGLLFRWWLVLAWGFAAFGAEYAVFLRLRGGAVDVRATDALDVGFVRSDGGNAAGRGAGGARALVVVVGGRPLRRRARGEARAPRRRGGRAARSRRRRRSAAATSRG